MRKNVVLIVLIFILLIIMIQCNKLYLKNEYEDMAYALLQKTYTVDFMTKKRVLNKGIVPQYYVEDDHEAIISKELFYRVQEEIMRRSSMCKAAETRRKHQRSKYSSTYALTGLVICGKCGHEYRRVTWAKRGKKKVVWRCGNRLENGPTKCGTSPSIEENLLHNAVMRAIQQIAAGNGDFVGAFRQNIIRVIGNYGNTEEKDEYDDMIKAKQDEMVALITENAQTGVYNEWFDKRYKAIADEIAELKEKQLETRRRKKLVENYDQRIKEMDDFLQNTSQAIPEFDNDLVRRLISNIKVISADEITIQFKSGIVMNQKLNEEW